jgi:hypothetical protein
MQDVMVTAPAGPNIVAETPILPNLADYSNLQNVYNNGVGQGRNNMAFAVVGDDTAALTSYLDPFGDGVYTVAPGEPMSVEIEAAIGRHLTDLGGYNSFSRQSVATGAGWLAQNLFDPATDPQCNGVETWLACELRVVNPAIVIINVGYNDVTAGTDPVAFQGTVETIIQNALDGGIIPVVATVYPIPGFESQTQAINEAIINAANNMTVPIFNQWRAFTEIDPAGNGLDGGGNPSVAPEGDDYVLQGIPYGANERNRRILILLNDLVATFFG